MIATQSMLASPLSTMKYIATKLIVTKPLFQVLHTNTPARVIIECRADYNFINLEAVLFVQEVASLCVEAVAHNWSLHTQVYS